MKQIYITRQIPEVGVEMLRAKGYTVDINQKDRPLSPRELMKVLKAHKYDAVLSLLTDQIDGEVMDASPSTKIFSNLAIGFNNFNIDDAKKRGVLLTNTPGGGAERVVEHTWAFILALTCRLIEGDTYMRKNKYKGWDPMLLPGTHVEGKTLGIIGTGKIGAGVAQRAAHGFMMKVVYYDIRRNEDLEKNYGAVFCPTVEEVLKVSDVVSLHVPLMKETHHLMNAERFDLMKKTAFLVNTSRGPVIDEKALVQALKNKKIAGAAIDVFENEPKMAPGLSKLPNVVLTPHIASASIESRDDMARKAAANIISYFETGKPINPVYN